jgi:hypothetical protein
VAELKGSTAERFAARAAGTKLRRYKQFYDAAGSRSRVERIIARGRGRPAAGRHPLHRSGFEEMQRQYAAGRFARYGELLQELGELLTPP